MPSASRRSLLRVFAAAWLLRLAWLGLVAALSGPVTEPDSTDYLRLGANLRSHASFARDEAGRVPDLKRTPGYPCLVAISGATAEAPWLLLGLQGLLSALTATLTVSAARLWGCSLRHAELAGWLVALDPGSIASAALILSETLFAFALILALLAWMRLQVAEPASGLQAGLWGAAAGAALAAATLTRPVALLLIPLVIWAIARSPRRIPLAAGALLLFGALVGGWVARNASVSGVPTLTTISATNLLDYKAAGALAAARGRPFEEVRRELRDGTGRDDPRRPPAQQAALASEKTRRALDILAEHPGPAAKQALKGAAILGLMPASRAALRGSGIHEGGTGLFSALVSGDFGRLGEVWGQLGSRRWLILAVTLLCGAHLALLGLGALGSGWQSIRVGVGRWELLGLALAAALLLAPAAGPEAEPRFRLPIIPLLAIAAAPTLGRFSRGRAEEAP